MKIGRRKPADFFCHSRRQVAEFIVCHEGFRQSSTPSGAAGFAPGHLRGVSLRCSLLLWSDHSKCYRRGGIAIGHLRRQPAAKFFYFRPFLLDLFDWHDFLAGRCADSLVSRYFPWKPRHPHHLFCDRWPILSRRAGWSARGTAHRPRKSRTAIRIN